MDENYQKKERRTDDIFFKDCLAKIKEHLYALNETVIIVKERQDNVIKCISENKIAIQEVQKELQSIIGKCPFEKEIKEICQQCAICRGSKKTWNSLPILIQLIISVITVLFILYNKN